MTTPSTGAPSRRAPPSHMRAVKTDPGQLELIRKKLRAARDLRLELTDAEARVSSVKEGLHKVERSDLPDLFTKAGIDTLGIPAEGNLPGYDADLKPYYRANIAASWAPEKRAEGFAALAEMNAGDLVRSTIVITLGPKTEKLRKTIVKLLRGLKVEFECVLDVPHMTLTAWLKRSVENGKLPPLDKIGGEVGQVVKLKERKE